MLKETCKCRDSWYGSPSSKSPHPPAVYDLHREHYDSVEEWPVDECKVEVEKRGEVVEVVNKPIEKVVHHQHTLNGVT